MSKNDSMLPQGIRDRGIYRDFEGDYWLFDGARLHLLTAGPWDGHDDTIRPTARVAGEFEARPDLMEPFEWVGA